MAKKFNLKLAAGLGIALAAIHYAAHWYGATVPEVTLIVFGGFVALTYAYCRNE